MTIIPMTIIIDNNDDSNSDNNSDDDDTDNNSDNTENNDNDDDNDDKLPVDFPSQRANNAELWCHLYWV